MTAPIRGNQSVVSWFENYHGEAPRHQTMISLTTWCIENSDRCNQILSIISDETMERLKWAAKDSGQLDEMSSFFENKKTKNGS